MTILIYEQTCDAEKRRRQEEEGRGSSIRRERVFINERVCEGCGDCSVQSNCVAVLPLETELGRKREIDQSSCNKDYSCAKGFCPSFVGIVGGRLKKRPGALAGAGAARFQSLVAALPVPAAHELDRPRLRPARHRRKSGGTGVVTVGAVIAMAAHLEGHSAERARLHGLRAEGRLGALPFVCASPRTRRR